VVNDSERNDSAKKPQARVPQAEVPRRPLWRQVMRWFTLGCGMGCGCGTLLLVLPIVALFWLLGSSVPASYRIAENPIPPPTHTTEATESLAGFSSPYMGHTGSWDGKGGAMFGLSKEADLDWEVEMGLKWTFMCVHWREMEPDGPVDLSTETPPAWKSLDAFVIAAHHRGLNILMQAPVVGGNAGGPPTWAGALEKGKSAPRNMDALVDFAGKLAARYAPGGTLAIQQEWGTSYGVRAWEMDNEPESYFTHWGEQEGKYAEFVTKASHRIKQIDPQALIAAAAVAPGSHTPVWLERALNDKDYALGQATDIVSFHNYEGLDSLFSGRPMTIVDALEQVREVYERNEDRSPAHAYARKQDYWHTEGNLDFIGAMSKERRAAWRFQFMTRAFAAGIRKVVVMDASAPEQLAVKTYIQALPDPFPMLPANREIRVDRGQAVVFRHPEPESDGGGNVWVAWAVAGTGDAEVEIPTKLEQLEVVSVTGQKEFVPAKEGFVRVSLRGEAMMAPPVLLIERDK
jgi:DNA-nicking Smr family endonuclease